MSGGHPFSADRSGELETWVRGTHPQNISESGWWGERETEKGPVDLFPLEPTDEAFYAEETLNMGSRSYPH